MNGTPEVPMHRHVLARSKALLALPLAAVALPAPALAADFDSGSTAWVLVSSALVLFMMIPGLALFYGGLVRTKNVLSVLMQCIALTAVITVLWFAFGYSLAFDTTGMQAGAVNLRSFVGGLGRAFLGGIGPESATGAIPEAAFFVFQLTFAVITPGLIVGAFAERMKFSAMLSFSALWLVFVYLPICHMTWGGPGGLFANWGVFDFAGGIVVHLTAGVAALVACLLVGPRQGYGKTPMLPHNMTMCFIGTGMLWVGWFGFNGGSALAADGNAALAVTATQISGATAAATWMAIEWIRRKPSVLGIATGAVAGLAAVTPASGFVGPFGGFAIGLTAGVCCYFAATTLKQRLGYDDSLDVFGVHGVGGFLGTVLAAVFAAPAFGGKGDPASYSIAGQLGTQLLACTIAAVYTAVVSYGLLRLVSALLGGLRVDADSEVRGLDLSLHDEAGYNT
jgi:Amt family ammonium transporter